MKHYYISLPKQLYGKKKKDFAEVIKDFEMRLSRVLQVGPLTSIFIRERQRKITQIEEEKDIWLQRQSLEWCGHKPRNASSHQELEKARNKFSLKASRGSMTLPTPWSWPRDTDLELLASKTVRIDLCCFKPLFVAICSSSNRKLMQNLVLEVGCCYNKYLKNVEVALE